MASRTDINPSNKLLHFLDLNEYGLEQVPPENRPAAKREVADYLVNEVLRKLNAGTSPVKGEGRFRILDPKYAKKEKAGVRTANLQLEGDLLDSLKSAPANDSFIKFGHEGGEVPKADGHNQLSGKAQSWASKSRHPKRRYIPDSGQKFTDDITEEIELIIKQFKVTTGNSIFIDALEDIALINLSSKTKETASPTQREAGDFVAIDNFFDDDVIGLLLEDALNRR